MKARNRNKFILYFNSLPILAALAFGSAECQAFSFFGLTAEAPPREVLWEAQNQFVQIVAQEAGARPSEHPVQLAPQELYDALGVLEMAGQPSMFKTKQAAMPVFAESERQTLARELSRGLGKARPTDDITFALIGMHEGLFSKERQVVAGRAFYQDGKLNIIFGDLHKRTGEGSYKDTRGIGYEIDMRLQPFTLGSRTKSGGSSGRVATHPGVSFAAGRSDWVELDLKTVIANLRPPETTAGGKAPVPAVREDAASTAERRQMREEMARMRREMRAQRPAAPSRAPGGISRSAKQRLGELKELRNHGLIDAEEFKAKRRQIIDEL